MSYPNVTHPSHNRFGSLRIGIASCLMVISGEVLGASAGTNQTQAAAAIIWEETSVAEPEIQRNTIFDTVQGSTSTHIVWLARWVDSFFDDPEYLEEEAYARATVQQNVRFYRNLDPAFSTHVRATVVLPNLSRRFRLSFEGNDELYSEDYAGGTEPNIADSTRESINDPSFRLLYLLLQRRDIDLGLSGGVRLNDFAFYTGPRLKARASLGSGWVVKLTQRIYWYTTNNLKSKTQLRFDHLLGKRNLFRQSFKTAWDEDKHESVGFRHTTTSSITQPLKNSSALRYAWSSVYLTHPDPRWTSTTLSVGYRRSVWRKWIILEAAPFVTWEEQFRWNPKPGFSVSLSTIFEKDQ